MKKNWFLAKENLKLRQRIAEKLDLLPVTAQLLINRGIKDEVEAGSFLNPILFDLPSPFLMKDMDVATERLYRALSSGEKIAVYGDYDVDGVTSISLFYSFASQLGMNVVTYNPDRISEGYGVNTEAIRQLADQGVSLIISADCGITAHNEVEFAKELGVDFIITDHHQPSDTVPGSVAVLNPNQKGCNYPAEEITGVGVVFNLVIAFRRFLRDKGFFKNGEPNLGDYLDLVALGTVADCAPITDVNRIMVKEGIKRIQDSKRLGIKALKEVSGLNGPVDSYDLSFKLGPRINAAGRLQSAKPAIDLLTTNDPGMAKRLAADLNKNNKERQSVEKIVLDEAVEMYRTDESLKKSSSIVLSSDNWHQGVIGIAASRLAEMYRKPTFLIAVDDSGTGKGSGRSIEGVNIYKILSEIGNVFENYGGHEQAAGISIKKENIEEFRALFSKAVSKIKVARERALNIDMELKLEMIDRALLKEIKRIAPFGVGNPEPVFLVSSVSIKKQKLIKQRHLNVLVSDAKRSMKAMWFNAGDKISSAQVADVVFTPKIDKWNGEEWITLYIKDVLRRDKDG